MSPFSDLGLVSNDGGVGDFKQAILHPELIPKLFYEGQTCPHGHVLRHKATHWCFDCASKIYSNQCFMDINHIHSSHLKYYCSVLALLPTHLDSNQCWEMPSGLRFKNQDRPRYTALTYRSFKTKSTESIALTRFIYFIFWGDVGGFTISKICKNHACWNPLHMKTKFNVKPLPKKVHYMNTVFDIQKSKMFHNNLSLNNQHYSTIESPSLKQKIIKDPKLNAEVEPGSKYRPLESQFLVDDRLKE